MGGEVLSSQTQHEANKNNAGANKPPFITKRKERRRSLGGPALAPAATAPVLAVCSSAAQFSFATEACPVVTDAAEGVARQYVQLSFRSIKHR